MDEEAIERIRGVFSKLSNKYSLEEMIGASTGKNNIGNRFFPQNMKDRLVTIGKLGKVKAFIELQKEWEEQYIKLHPNFYIQNLPKLMELTRQLQYKRFLIIKVASELEDENIP